MAKTSSKSSKSTKSSKSYSKGKSTSKSSGSNKMSGGSGSSGRSVSKTYGSASKATSSSVSSLGKLGGGGAKTTISKMSGTSSGISRSGVLSSSKVISYVKSSIAPSRSSIGSVAKNVSSGKSINVMSRMGISKGGAISGAKSAVTKNLTGVKSSGSVKPSSEIKTFMVSLAGDVRSGKMTSSQAMLAIANAAKTMPGGKELTPKDLTDAWDAGAKGGAPKTSGKDVGAKTTAAASASASTGVDPEHPYGGQYTPYGPKGLYGGESNPGGMISKTFAEAGGEENFRAQIKNKYPNQSDAKVDRLVDIQKAKEGTLSASSVFGNPTNGMSPKEYDYTEASIFRGQGHGAPLTRSEEVSAFNIATGVNNATSTAYKDSLASDKAKGFAVQDYSNVSGLTQAKISTDAANRLAGGQDVKALTPSYSEFRKDYANSAAHAEHGYAGIQNNWNAYKEGWMTREEALSGSATHMPTVGIPSKHPTEAYVPPGYGWDPVLGIMSRPSVSVGEATQGGLKELQAYENQGNTLSKVIPEAPKKAAVSYMVG